MKKILLLMIILTLSFSLTSCKNPIKSKREMKNIIYTTLTGIDKSENIENGVRVVYEIIRPEEESDAELKKSAKKKKSEILVGEGDTIFDASRNTRPTVNGSLFGGSSEFLIIGEEAAKDGIYKYIDHQTKDHDIRLNIVVMIAKGTTSTEIIQTGATQDRTMEDTLIGLYENMRALSITNKIDMIELMKEIDNEASSPIIPTIEIISNTSEMPASDTVERIRLGGYAVLKDNTLLSYLNDEESKGVNWITNRMKSSTYSVESDLYNNIGISITKASSKITPEVSNSLLTSNININVEYIIADQNNLNNNSDPNFEDNLNEEIEELIMSDVNQAIRYTQENNVDILGLNNHFYHKYPDIWDEIKENWALKLSTMSFNVTINCKNARSKDFNPF